jgi:hypothetical protein
VALTKEPDSSMKMFTGIHCANKFVEKVTFPTGSTVALSGARFCASDSRLWLALLFDDSLVLIMRADPYPDEILPVLNRQRSVVGPSSHGPKLANLFKV